MKHAAATLGSGNLRLAVMLPEGEDLNEWVAVNSKYKNHYLLAFNINNRAGHIVTIQTYCPQYVHLLL